MAQRENADAVAERAVSAPELTPEEYESVTTERKMERKRTAEEKRLDGLRRIAEMKSRHGIHPVEQGIVPDVWLLIMGVLSPQDRYNMCLVHPFFNSLMEDQGMKVKDILLPLVLDYNLPLFTCSLQSSDDIKKRIKTLRLVSKSVRDAVDKWIEEDLLHQMKNSMYPKLTPVSLDIKDSNFANRISVYTASELGLEGPKKLFLRSLKIVWVFGSITNDVNDFINYISEFLEKVGNQIWYLEFDVKYLEIPNSQIYNVLKDWLLLVPNLKWLNLEHVFVNKRGWNSFNHQDNPMPRLNAMERVDLPWSMESRLITEAVLTTNVQIKYVLPETMGLAMQPSVVGTSLETLGLGDRKVCCGPLLLQRISNSGWVLKKLHVLVDPYVVDTLLRFLPNLTILEDVSLHLGKLSAYLGVISKSRTRTPVAVEVDFIQLPNLKHFSINFGSDVKFNTEDQHFFFDLHFLLHCGKLESLTWGNHMHSQDLREIRTALNRDQKTRLINFPGEGVMNWDSTHSNVWNVFPSLRVIKLLDTESLSLVWHIFNRP